MAKKKQSMKSTEFNKAYDDAEKIVQKERIQKLAAEIRRVLEARMNAHERIVMAKDEIRILEMDLEDLKRGKLNKIRERQQKDEVARKYSKIDVSRIEQLVYPMAAAQGAQSGNWVVMNATPTTISSALTVATNSLSQ